MRLLIVAASTEWPNMKREILSWVLVRTAVLAFRSFAFASYYIPSESMVPNLLVGDRIVVSKWAYGFGPYNTEFFDLPLEQRVLARPLSRGDIAVFKLPRDNETDYIKRIIGLPGDEIQFRGGVAFINGEMITRLRIDDFVWTGPEGQQQRAARFEETLPGGRRYVTLDWGIGSRGDDFGPATVPEGHYFAVGDHRDNSLDSRFSKASGVGFVPARNLVGRAEAILWSWSGEAEWTVPATWLNAFRGDRAVSALH